MRHRTAGGCVLALLLWGGLAWGQSFVVEQFQATVSATEVNSTVNLDGRREVLLINDGPGTVYVNLINGTATTADFPLKVGEFLSPAHRVGPQLGLVCATSQTATVRVLGVTYQLR